MLRQIHSQPKMPSSNGEPDFSSIEDRSSRFVSTAKKLVFIYIWLWLLEGALRKWVPVLNFPLLVIRDPIAILIYIYSARGGVFRLTGPVFLCVIFAALLGVVGLVSGVNWLVALYGLRTYVLHVPLIFVIGSIFTRVDLQRASNILLLMSVPMAFLVGLQYVSDPGSWVNEAAGGDKMLGVQADGVFGKVRPAGLFSFGSGLTLYLSISLCFVCARLIEGRSIKVTTAVSYLGLLMVMYALSISRAAILQAAIVVGAFLFISLTRNKNVGPILVTSLVGLVLSLLLVQIPLIGDGVYVFMERWYTASGDIGESFNESIVKRTFGTFTEFLDHLETTPVAGFGLGLGTNAGSYLTTGGTSFLMAENEWSRILMECGPIVGTAYIMFRVYLSIIVLYSGFLSYMHGSGAGLLFSIACFLGVANGQWGPPVTLGATVLFAGFAMAFCRNNNQFYGHVQNKVRSNS